MKHTFLLIFIFTSGLLYSQEKLKKNIYSYGNVTSSINGKTLVYYNENDPKGEAKMIKLFTKKGIDAISWNKIFMPSVVYPDSEISESLRDNYINTVIFIKENGKSYTITSSNISAVGSSSDNKALFSYGTSTSNSTISNMGYNFEIYGEKDGFSRPLAVINGSSGNFMARGHTKLTLKIVDDILSELEKEGAF